MRSKQRESMAPITADTYVQKSWNDLWANVAGLLGANLIFLVWCAPYGLLRLLGLPQVAILVAPFTVGPGLVGLLTYIGNLARDRPSSFWDDSFKGAYRGFAASAGLGLITTVALEAYSIAGEAAVSTNTQLGFLALWASQLGILLCLAMLHVHSLNLVALYQQRVLQALRNAFVLSFAHPGATLAMISIGVLSYELTKLGHGAPVIIVPAVAGVLTVNNTLMLVPRHLPEDTTDHCSG